MRLYPIIAPLILTPLSYMLWHGDPIGWLVPILWAYIVPGIGTNVLKIWEFDTRLRLGRFRPHHGFVFGSATSMLGWVVHQFAQTPLVSAIAMALVLGTINFAYDVKALQSGILRVYNQPWSEGRSNFDIALDYAPWFFGGFGAVYGYGLVAGNFTFTLLASLTLPTAGYIAQSLLRHGHPGIRPCKCQSA
jgi:hypothetical protein